MKLGKLKEDVIELVKFETFNLIRSPQDVEDILEFSEQVHDIPRSDILSVINDVSKLHELDYIELGIIASQVMMKTTGDVNFLNKFYTDNEINEMKIYKRPSRRNELSRTFKDVIKVNDKMFIVVLPRSIIAKIYDQGWFIWDEKVQREGKKIEYGDSVFSIPKINFSNVKEIEKQVLDGVLIENALTYNLLHGSADEYRELYYDDKKLELTLADSFKGQIIDGMHRTIGIHRAWMKNKNIKGVMPIVITNYTIKEAERYLYESSKAVPIDKSKLLSMSNERLTDRIVDNLMTEGYLKSRISKNSRPSSKYGELVSYKTLSDAFHDLYEKEGNVKVSNLIDDFQEYLMYLFDYFGDTYLDDANSVLFKNIYFYLHVYIMKKMNDNNIAFSKLRDIIKPELFNNKSAVLNSYRISGYKENNIRSRKFGLKFIDDVLFKEGGKENGILQSGV